jgi:folate-binding protein YgfZ
MSDIPYSSITVSGPDSCDFLQAQLTTDIAAIAEASSDPVRTGHSDQINRVTEIGSIRSAWCNPKGRVICMPFLSKNAESYILTIPTELVELVTQRMTMFRFRSKVEFVAQTASPEELGIGTTVDDWMLENLCAGIPEIWLPESEKFTPHMLNLDLLDIISLDKGCYPGQEIVARTHFRGASKRRCLRFESAEPLSPGDKVSDGQRDVGEIVNAIGNDLLAVVPLNKKDVPLEVNGVALRYVALPYIG